MILTADQVVAAITYLVPGFIALKILYVFGFRSKRSDLEWAIWSLLASVAVAPISTWIGERMGWISAATYADKVKSCAAPIVSGPEADRVGGVVACATSALAQQTQNGWLLLVGVLLGVALGAGLVLAWKTLNRVAPGLGAKGIATAWDRRLDRDENAPWVEVLLGDGRRLQGILTSAASDVETDKADLFLSHPGWLDQSGQRHALDNVEGVWIARSEVKIMVIIGPSQEQPSGSAAT